MTPLLPALEVDTAEDPTHAVIWLHGLGADGADFVSVVPELGLASVPAVRLVFPHAPSMPVTCNGGYPMEHSVCVEEIRAIGLWLKARM